MKYLLIMIICSIVTYASETETPSPVTSDPVTAENTESQETESQETESQETESQETESQETESQETETGINSSATLRITTTTDSVIVLVNKSREGMTPLLLEDLSPGTYDIMLLKQGYERMQKSIDLSAGENRVFTAELDEIAKQSKDNEENSEDTTSPVMQEEIQEEKSEEKQAEEEDRRIFEIVATSVFASMVILITAFELSDM